MVEYHTTDTINGYSFIALGIVVLGALFGSFLINLLNGVKKFAWPISLYLKSSKPIFNFIIPSLIGNILMGFFLRNFLKKFIIMKYYSPFLGNKIRMICLGILLFRAGTHVVFRKQGLPVLCLLVFPIALESITVAIIDSFWLFKMPFLLALSCGIMLSATAPSVLIPCVMKLQQAGYGINKGIPITMIVTDTFNNVGVIVLFGIINKIATAEINQKGEKEAIYIKLLIIFKELVIGIAAGLTAGGAQRLIRKQSPKLKVVVVVLLVIGPIILFDLYGLEESKFIYSAAFGYMVKQKYVWGHRMCTLEMNKFWKICKPFLFGTIGAALMISDIKPYYVGYSFITFIFMVPMKMLGCFCCLPLKKYNLKERIFLSVGWLPKATVQSALGPLTLILARQNNNQEWIQYGQIILTLAVLSVLVFAPLGAFSSITFGPKLLHKTLSIPEKPSQDMETQSLKMSEVIVVDQDLDDLDQKDAQSFSKKAPFPLFVMKSDPELFKLAQKYQPTKFNKPVKQFGSFENIEGTNPIILIRNQESMHLPDMNDSESNIKSKQFEEEYKKIAMEKNKQQKNELHKHVLLLSNSAQKYLNLTPKHSFKKQYSEKIQKSNSQEDIQKNNTQEDQTYETQQFLVDLQNEMLGKKENQEEEQQNSPIKQSEKVESSSSESK